MAAAGETPAEAAVEKYRPFVHQLTTDAALLYCLYKEPPNPSGLDLWARALAVASLHFGTIVSLTHTLFAYEVGKTPESQHRGGSIDKASHFLRQTTLLSKILDAFSLLQLQDYLASVSGPIISHVVNEIGNRLIELDGVCEPAEPGGPEPAHAVVIRLLTSFLDAFEASIDTAPPVLRLICNQIVKVAHRCNGDAAFMVSSFLMLRCLTPSLCVPDRYGLLEALGLPPLDGRRRANLVCLSRVLQKLVNNTTFEGKTSPGYAGINAAFSDLRPRYKDAILRFCKPPASALSAYKAATAAPRRKSFRGSLRSDTGSPLLSSSYSGLVDEPLNLDLDASLVSEQCHVLHREVHHSFSCFVRNVGHLLPLLDNHALCQNLLALLPPPPARLRPKVAPPLAHGDGGAYAALLAEAHAPESVAEKLLAVSRTRFLKVAGMNAERTCIVQLVSHRMPVDDEYLHAMLLYFILTMDGIARHSYVIVVLDSSQAVNPKPLAWLRKAFSSSLPERYVNHLKVTYFLNPPSLVRNLLGFLQPLVTGQKLKYFHNLPSLIDELKVEPRRFPVSHALMEACHGAAVEKTIGVKVADVMARAEQRTRDYPSLPYQCIKWLAVHGLDSASLFDPPLPEAREHSMGQEDLAELGLRHTAGMLVSFIKDIPRGLFAASFDELMRAAADLCVAEEAAADAVPATERVHTALSHLPSEHLALCTDLFLFLHQLCLNPGAGGVRLSVLSDRFAPQIFPYSSSRNATAEATLVGYLISQSSAEFWERIWDLVE